MSQPALIKQISKKAPVLTRASVRLAGKQDISYQRFCELVMGQDRMDNSSLVMASKHSADDIHSNSEMLMRKRIRESGKDLRQVSLRRHTLLAPRQGCVLPEGSSNGVAGRSSVTWTVMAPAR